uniref:hypothetical protein n=1 Tax=Cellvibrio fontiphilus TaxID=1815559 RepID=UPI002B4BFC02|nr:hypothetical protein [Cellvibrio fontiphilus]
MAITRIKLITIVAARGGDSSNLDLEVTVNGMNWESVSGQQAGAVKETIIDLPTPISIDQFNFSLFDLSASSMDGEPRLLLDSIYVVDASPGSPNQLLIGIPNWPKNLWFSASPSFISGGLMLNHCNLGVIAKMFQ